MNLYETRLKSHVNAFYFNGTLDECPKEVGARLLTADEGSRCSRCGSPMKYHARLNDGNVICPCTYWIINGGKMQIMGKDEFESTYTKVDVEDVEWHSL